MLYMLIFQYIPMYGVIMAFQDFSFKGGIFGSEWVGLENFRYLFGLPDFYRVLTNSISLSLLRLVFSFPVPIILALMINEIPWIHYKKAAQTVIYLPYFISWVVIGGILVNLLSPSWGIVNLVLQAFGVEPIFFMGEVEYFRPIVIISHIWKQAGWDTIIYLCLPSHRSIQNCMKRQKSMEPANSSCIFYVTLPCIRSTIVILLLLSIGGLMGNGFEQINVLQNSNNIMISEVFETYTYRVGMVNGRFSFATTVGLFSSTVGFILLLLANGAAKLLGEDGIF